MDVIRTDHLFRPNPHIPTSCAVCGDEQRFHAGGWSGFKPAGDAAPILDAYAFERGKTYVIEYDAREIHDRTIDRLVSQMRDRGIDVLLVPSLHVGSLRVVPKDPTT